jgi:general secretion pathway protein D
LLGRLFGSQKNNEKKTEILLSITPRLVRNLQRQEASINEFLGGTDSNLRLRPDFKVGALEEVIANPAINREPVPVPAQPVASPIAPAAQPPQTEPVLPPVIQLTDTDSAAKPKAVQAKPDPKARAEELKLKQAEAAEEKKQLLVQKRAAAEKAREEKLLEKKRSLDKDKASPETRQFIDSLMKQKEAP